MNDFFILNVLAVVQSIAEWLPISSSGHLVLVEKIFHNYSAWNIEAKHFLFINVFFHFITLLSLVCFIHKELFELFRKKRLIVLIVIADIPAAIAGLFFRDFISDAMQNLLWIGICFFLTACVLMFANWQQLKKKHKLAFTEKKMDDMSFLDAITIGFAQSFALFPGISRSAVTISSAMLRNVQGREAAMFSVLISIPLILGAFLFELKNVESLPSFNLFHIIFSASICFVLSLFALRLLFHLSERYKIHLFSYYLFPLSFFLFFLNN